eukprot:g37900.t1
MHNDDKRERRRKGEKTFWKKHNATQWLDLGGPARKLTKHKGKPLFRVACHVVAGELLEPDPTYLDMSRSRSESLVLAEEEHVEHLGATEQDTWNDEALFASKAKGKGNFTLDSKPEEAAKPKGVRTNWLDSLRAVDHLAARLSPKAARSGGEPEPASSPPARLDSPARVHSPARLNSGLGLVSPLPPPPRRLAPPAAPAAAPTALNWEVGTAAFAALARLQRLDTLAHQDGKDLTFQSTGCPAKLPAPSYCKQLGERRDFCLSVSTTTRSQQQSPSASDEQSDAEDQLTPRLDDIDGPRENTHPPMRFLAETYGEVTSQLWTNVN